MKLIELIHIAQEKKPKFGEPCNNCGWCCLTEVCPMGQFMGAGEMLPCKFLRDNMCLLIEDGHTVEEAIGVGTGCDAKTQAEALELLK